MSEERWRWVDGYEGLYMVSDQGRVMGLPKSTHCGHVMKTKIAKNGYENVCLCKGNVKSDKRVHRLVAQAFISNPAEKSEVNHRNGVRHDNRAENLEWATRSENEKHAYRVLGKSPNKPWANKPRRFARKFSDEQVRAIRSDSRGCTLLADEYGVSKTTIKNIRNRKIYKEVV